MKNIKTNRLDKEKLIECYRKNGSAVKTGLEFEISGPTVLKIVRSFNVPVIKERKNYIDDIHNILGSQPSPVHSLDRIDNNGPYEITNLRWATNSEQVKNQRRNIKN